MSKDRKIPFETGVGPECVVRGYINDYKAIHNKNIMNDIDAVSNLIYSCILPGDTYGDILHELYGNGGGLSRAYKALFLRLYYDNFKGEQCVEIQRNFQKALKSDMSSGPFDDQTKNEVIDFLKELCGIAPQSAQDMIDEINKGKRIAPQRMVSGILNGWEQYNEEQRREVWRLLAAASSILRGKFKPTANTRAVFIEMIKTLAQTQ